jgi:hypothetical protein
MVSCGSSGGVHRVTGFGLAFETVGVGVEVVGETITVSIDNCLFVIKPTFLWALIEFDK